MLTKKTIKNQVKNLEILQINQNDENQNLKQHDYLSEIQMSILQIDKNTTLIELLKFVLEKIMYYERKEFLAKSNNIEGKNNKGNGFYKRFLNALGDKIKLSIPRDRKGIYNPLILEIIKNEEQQYYDLISQLYMKGLTHGDISSIMNNIYKKNISSASISNITKGLMEEFEIWNKREFNDGEDFIGIYIDGLFQSVKRGNSYSSEGFTVVLGIRLDGTREILGIYSIPEENSSAWGEVLQDLKERGITKPLYIVSDGIKGFENQVEKIYPNALFQKCIVHKERNILNKVRASDKSEISSDLKEIFTAGNKENTTEKAMNKLDKFIEKWTSKDKGNYKFLKNMFNEKERKYYFSYLNFPLKIQSMIYTTNWLERFNKSARKKLKIRNGLPSIDAVIKLLFATALELGSGTYSYKIGAFNSIKDELLEIRRERYGST